MEHVTLEPRINFNIIEVRRDWKCIVVALTKQDILGPIECYWKSLWDDVVTKISRNINAKLRNRTNNITTIMGH